MSTQKINRVRSVLRSLSLVLAVSCFSTVSMGQAVSSGARTPTDPNNKGILRQVGKRVPATTVSTASEFAEVEQPTLKSQPLQSLGARASQGGSLSSEASPCSSGNAQDRSGVCR